MLELDNTKRAAFVKCRRKYYFEHVMNLRTFWGSTALRYGLTWHAGQDAYSNHVKENGWTRDGSALEVAFSAMQKEWEEASSKGNFYTDYRTLENCFNSFLSYIQHFQQDELIMKIISTEEPFKIHMAPAEDEENLFADLEPFFFTGKIDTEVELNEQLWLNEHKTTGQPIDTQCNRLNRSAQVMGYFYARLRKNSGAPPPAGVLMTVHHLSARKSTAKGREGEYGTPKIDFRRVPQIFSENDICQWRRSFLSTALDIQREEKRGLWPMCHDSCFDYGSCPYLDICQQNTDVNNIFLDESRYYVAEPWEVAKSITAEGVVY